MNKKKLLVFSVLGLFAITFVAAIGYYALFSASFNVLPSITLEGETEQTLGDVYDGEIIEGSLITLSNDAPSERLLTFSEESECDIETSYVGYLSLTKKDTTTWVPVGDPISIGYTIIGDEFEVTGVPVGYTAIYYKDEVVGLEGRIANPQPAISIVGAGNLPQLDDANVDALANYCAEPDNYNQCKGAKIWVVPTADIVAGNLIWANMADYYYETDLIQYNAEGEIVLSPGASLTLTPVYEIGAGESGECVVTTTVA